MCGDLPLPGSEKRMYALRHTTNHTTTGSCTGEESFMKNVVVHEK